MKMFIPLSSMDADLDWDDWNEKFIEKVLLIVNSERVKYQRASRRVLPKRTKSQYVFSGTINEIAVGSKQHISTPSEIQADKVRPLVSDRQMQ
jgi:hypothetical protein